MSTVCPLMPWNASVQAAVACQIITSITYGFEHAFWSTVEDIEIASGCCTIQLHIFAEA